ncbi:MAG: 30S ribosomal protein S17 [Candidatus Taylorbacteria bacterium]|nr:30S ribosomal protein S17 [Candidatus Taylorbacteria bacterium]
MEPKKVTKSEPSKKPLRGKVVSTKMKDTIVVAIDRFIKHPKYDKYFKVTKRFKAHDAGNTKKEGELVSIVECRPISKDKHFTVV